MDVVIGLGEIGFPLWKLLNDCGRTTYGWDLDKEKRKQCLNTKYKNIKQPSHREVEVLHICIPGTPTNKFINIVTDCVTDYEPKGVIIHSTIEPQTTDKIYDYLSWNWDGTGLETIEVAHSPINGKHSNMYESLKTLPKYIGFAKNCKVDTDNSVIMGCLLDVFGGGVVTLPDAKTSEWAKLLATTYFGWQIAFHQEIERIANAENLSFDGIKSIIDIKSYTTKSNIGHDYTPPFYSGVIGGHCVMANIDILKSTHPSKFWDLIEQSNELKEKQIEPSKSNTN